MEWILQSQNPTADGRFFLIKNQPKILLLVWLLFLKRGYGLIIFITRKEQKEWNFGQMKSSRKQKNTHFIPRMEKAKMLK
jgi:hypothetical protein